ncbi:MULTISPECIES: major capsid protein [unclassified Pseudomonas]|uniref:major capsid protein n=1 Tax=unclassified Pseudomonas TaxID=196821 RepID=UPI00244BF5A9|nr:MULTISPECIES: major capsid protein [unclassified Pseudomonas]MDG9926361.1 major capsid protein [Pseudomonas sp. GD04045]MDH0037610.1 major capsid protein [Pseudomonas sp. GD04019]
MRNLQTLKRSIGAAAAVGVLSIQQAHAALDTEVTSAITAGKTDALALGALVIAVIIGIAALKWLRKAL